MSTSSRLSCLSARRASCLELNLDVGVKPRLYSHSSIGHDLQLRRGEIAVPDPDEAYLQIGEVAERTGVTQRTLRFYEEKGLLRPPTRMDGGFRLYSEQDVKRVEHIRRLQDLLGVALAEIKEMVDAEEVLRELRAQYRPDSAIDEKRRQLERAIDVVQGQYSIVKQKTEQMEEMKAQLKERLKTFDRWMKELNELEAKEPVAPA
ncbi:MAG: MerR family transcriptional regulator [Chloroflexi bacterium]|nr:MAG: MerR family transcriptional regulator [Chloroflexota bacterium]